MRKSLILALVCVAMCSMAFGADPWRMKVQDLDPNAPFTLDEVSDVMIDSAIGSWGSNGGLFRAYFWGGPTMGNSTAPASYNATTGALSFGTPTLTGFASGPWTDYANKGLYQNIKDGSTYKTWRRFGSWDGHEMQYASSTDGANFGAATYCTVFGATVTSTGTYGFPGIMKTTSGVYIGTHRNSGAGYQCAGGTGSMTSTGGDTEWYDTDTGWPDPVVVPGYDPSMGDAIADPHTAGQPWDDQDNFGKSVIGCDGNLLQFKGQFPSYGWVSPAPRPQDNGGAFYAGNGLGLLVSTGGELVGSDSYVWLADPDSTNTTGIGNSLLSAIGNPGLSGPSLRARMTNWWTGYFGQPLPLASAITTPSTKFMLLYEAAWDTNSSGNGDILDVYGTGRAKFSITKNRADLNFDGTVNSNDIGPFSAAYGSTSGVNANYNADADFNADGKVNSNDIGPFSVRYGSNCSY